MLIPERERHPGGVVNDLKLDRHPVCITYTLPREILKVFYREISMEMRFSVNRSLQEQ
jgi:hypothetical protein